MASESSGAPHTEAMPPSLLYLGVLVLMSLITAGVYAWDKRRAQRGGRRVSEARLLTLALLGGGMGAYWAMRTVRHKTKHWRFRILVPLITLVQLAVFGSLLYREFTA